MDASSRDNRTTAVHENVTCKNKNLLFVDRKESNLTNLRSAMGENIKFPQFPAFHIVSSY